MVCWIGDLARLKQSTEATPHCVQQTSGRTWQQSLLLGGMEATTNGGMDIRLAHWLPGHVDSY